MPKFNDTTARDLRSIIQNMIIREQRSGVTLAHIEMPALPEYPERITLREAIENARIAAEGAEDKKSESTVNDADNKGKMTFRAELTAALSERRQARQERKTMRLYYKLNCRTKVLKNDIECRVSLERIIALEEVLQCVEDMYIDDAEDIYISAGGMTGRPVPMHKE